MATTDTDVTTKRKRPKDRSNQILREAFRLIAASGFNAVSLSDIAKACDIQKSSVLHHYPSMNHLLLAVLEMREREDAYFYLEGQQHDFDLSPAGVRRQLTRVFEHNLERPEFSRLYSILSVESLAPEHPAHKYFQDRERISRQEITRLMSWKSSPELAAAELLAFWAGLEIAGQHDSTLDTRAVWNNFCDRFFI